MRVAQKRLWPISTVNMTGHNDSSGNGRESGDFRTGDNRTHRRLLCSDLVTVCWTGVRGFPREEVAVLEDYSSIGAGLFLTVKIDPGVPVRLRTEWESFSGMVKHCAWRENGYLLGIEFDQPRSDSEAYTPDHLLDLADLSL